jgi:hypothetical protein
MAPRKKSDRLTIDKLLKKAEEAKKTGLALTRIAVEQAELSGRQLSKEGRKKIDESIAESLQKKNFKQRKKKSSREFNENFM